MSCEVNIYIETSYRGPAKRKGVAMWLVEYKKKDGTPVTRDGMIYLDESTENQASLMAVAAAVNILNKKCLIRVNTRCEHILNTIQNYWHIKWQQNGWCNAKGNPIKNAEQWKEMLVALEKHSYTFVTGHHEYREWMLRSIRKAEDG